MKTILILIVAMMALTVPTQSFAQKSNELIPFHFEKSGVQISVLFRHSLVYATTKTIMLSPENDLQPNPYLSFEFLPSDKYYACASKQLEILTSVLKSKEISPLKNKFQSINLTVMILPTTAAATLCPTVLRSSQKQLVMGICLDDSRPLETSCETVSSARIALHYNKREDMAKSRQAEEDHMKKAAEGLLQWMQP